MKFAIPVCKCTWKILLQVFVGDKKTVLFVIQAFRPGSAKQDGSY